MPIILDKKWGGRFYDTFTLECASDVDTEATLRLRQARKGWKLADLNDVVRKGKHPFWINAVEHPLTQELIPKQLRLVRGKELPDYIHSSPAGKLVSGPLKALIDSQESAEMGHQLFPIEVKTANGTPYPQDYYVWEVWRKIDGVVPDSEGVKSVGGPANGEHLWTYKPLGRPPTSADLKLSQNAIGGLSAWTDFRFRSTYIFISDALVGQMKANGISGFSSQSEWSVQ